MPKEKLEELAFASYWDKRYEEEKAKIAAAGEASGAGADAEASTEPIPSFEWFRTFEKLRPFLDKYLPSAGAAEGKGDVHMLHLGCGNSTLTHDLYTLGYTQQTSVDFSGVVISAMQAKYANLLPADTCKWLQIDVRDMSGSIAGESVDVAIDKGTLDAMLHGSLWDPPEEVRENVGRYVDEVARVLKPGARWLYITYRQPHFLRPLLKREEVWDAEVEVLEEPEGGTGGGFEYFGWVMTKKKKE